MKRASPRLIAVPPEAPGGVSTTLVALAVFGVSAVTAAGVLIAAGGWHAPAGHAAMLALIVGAPVATGLYAVRQPGTARFGRLLLVAAASWSFTALALSQASLPYTVGRIAAWTIFPTLAYLMMAFPHGRLAGQRDRALFGAVTAVVVVLYLGSTPFIEDFPTSSPWTTCTTDCPPNAFFVLSSEPGAMDVVAFLRDALGALLLVAVTISLAARLRGASTVRRLTVAPVIAVSAITTAVLAAFLTARRLHADPRTVRDIGIAWTLCLPALAAAFSIGLVQRRLLVASALTNLSRALHAPLDPEELRTVLRSTVGDAALEVLVRNRLRGDWVDSDGFVVRDHDLPGDGRTLRVIEDSGGPLAAIVIDRDLDPDDELVETVAAVIEAALREAQLQTELEASLSDLEDSRKRIATAADAERRRIERDLHDGAQQRLIALRLRLSLAEDLLPEDAPAAVALRGLEDAVDQTLEDIRSLAHGIYPALLADRGLADALRSAARRAPLPVRIHAKGVTRHAPELESAVYFSCLEAVQNVAKHAPGTTIVEVRLHQNDVLRFSVADDGPGFDLARAGAGAGLRNMRDRVESVGGTLTIDARRGRGTTISGMVPLPDQRQGTDVDVVPPLAWDDADAASRLSAG